MRTTAARSTNRSGQQEPRRYYRIQRQYSSQRPPRALVLELLRAHSSE